MGRKGYVEKILIQVSNRVEKREFEKYSSLRATVRPRYDSGSFVQSVGSSRPFWLRDCSPVTPKHW